MKIRCGDEIMDLDLINQYRPDGRSIFCQVVVTKYGEEGSFDLLTEDKGQIHIEALAFKMLFDMCVTFDVTATRYLVYEMDRGVCGMNGETDGLVMYKALKKDTVPFAKTLLEQGIHASLMLRNYGKVTMANMGAVLHRDIWHDIKTGTVRGTNRDRLIAHLSRYLYLEERDITFFDWVRALSEVMRTLSHEDLYVLVDRFYDLLIETRDDVKNLQETLDNHEKGVYDDTTPVDGCMDTSVADIGDSDCAENTDDESLKGNDQMYGESRTKVQDEDNDQHGGYATDNNSDTQDTDGREAELTLVSASDITGKEGTYGANYCEAFYDKKLENADSDGFLDQTVASRANGTAAPIDVLSETVRKEHSAGSQAETLRDSITELRESIEAAATTNK